jgi:hypothetical protein
MRRADVSCSPIRQPGLSQVSGAADYAVGPREGGKPVGLRCPAYDRAAGQTPSS